MKQLVFGLSLTLITAGAFASDTEMTVKTVEIKSSTSKSLPAGDVGGAGPGIVPAPQAPAPAPAAPAPGPAPAPSAGWNTAITKIGQVLSTATSVVALGEKVYDLVQKGKPSNTTEYAPISVVPKDPSTKEAVNPFDLEGCSIPTQKKYKTTMTTAGVEVVVFEYTVVYSYGCSYNSVGKYIQSLQVIPVRVKTSYGWDFNASMKLSGIMNHGTKADPVVGAILAMKYTMKSWRTALERNDAVHVSGNGQLKTLSL